MAHVAGQIGETCHRTSGRCSGRRRWGGAWAQLVWCWRTGGAGAGERIYEGSTAPGEVAVGTSVLFKQAPPPPATSRRLSRRAKPRLAGGDAQVAPAVHGPSWLVVYALGSRVALGARRQLAAIFRENHKQREPVELQRVVVNKHLEFTPCPRGGRRGVRRVAGAGGVGGVAAGWGCEVVGGRG